MAIFETVAGWIASKLLKLALWLVVQLLTAWQKSLKLVQRGKAAAPEPPQPSTPPPDKKPPVS